MIEDFLEADNQWVLRFQNPNGDLYVRDDPEEGVIGIIDGVESEGPFHIPHDDLSEVLTRSEYDIVTLEQSAFPGNTV